MYQLVAEVLDHAPGGLDATAVLLLVAIAEDTRTPGEIREIGTESLCRRTRVDARGLRHVVARLADAGIKIRVPIGTDRLGRPLYAVPGRVPQWSLPTLSAPEGCSCRTCTTVPPQPVDNATQGGHPRPPSQETPGQKGGVPRPPTEQGGHTSPAGGDTRPPAGHPRPPAGDTRPPYPSRPVHVIDQRSGSTVTYITGLTGATDDEARHLIKTVTQRHRPRSIGAYIRGIPPEDLRELAAELREAKAPPPAALRPQCGQCGPNRLIEAPNGTVTRCPACHPRARQARRTA
jgi:hypothetical protein